MGKEKSQENNPKKKSKLLKIIGIVVLSVILIIAITSYFLLKTPANKDAYLSTFEGDVQVFTNNNWQTPILNQELSLNDKIKTNDGGTATLLLMEKAIISIEPNTEVEISSLTENDLKIKQSSGSTWNKFLGIVGVDTYSVETPNAVASVRGTEFNIKNNTAIVSEGTVNYGNEKSSILLNKYEKAQISENEVKKQELTKEEKTLILEKKKETLNNLKKLRTIEIEKNKFLVNKVKDMYKLTDADIAMYLEKIDTGEIDDNMLIEKSPVKTDSLKKVKKINDEIKNTNKDIAELEKELNSTN